MKRLFVLVLLAAGLALFACAKQSKNAGVVEEESQALYKMVSMEEGLALAQSNPDALIVDVRRSDEFSEGHIPGALLFSVENISEENAAQILPDKNQVILVYCRSGRRSLMAAKKLSDMGYTNILEMGGIIDYTGELEK